MAIYWNCEAGTGKPAARVGDSVNCPLHGTTSIISGSPNTFHDDLAAVRVGDKTNCGDTIIGGSSSVFINGKPAAFVGCATAHGGKIISGSSSVFIGSKNDETLDSEGCMESQGQDYSLMFDFSEMHEAGNHNNIIYVNMPVMIAKPDGTYITTIRTDEYGMTNRFFTEKQEEIVAWANSGYWDITEECESVDDEDVSGAENG